MSKTKLKQISESEIQLKCECGLIHNIEYNEDTENLTVETLYKKESKTNDKTDNKNEKEESKNEDTTGTKRKSIFGFEG